MPYDPTPGGDQYFPSIQWDERGNPFQLTASGKRAYIPPASAATAPADNPVGARLRAWANGMGSTYENPGGAYPESGFAHNRGTWDGASGTFDTGNFFNTSLGGLLLGGGAMAAPFAIGALAGGAGPTSTFGPLAGGYGGATSEFAIPAALDASGLATGVGAGAAAATGPAASLAGADSSLLPAAGGVGGTGAGAYGPLANAYGGATTDYTIPPGLDPNFAGDMGGFSPQGPYADAYGGATNQPEIPGSLLKNGSGIAGLLTDPKWSPLLKTLAGVGGLLGGKALAGDPNDSVPPQLSQLLDLAMQRATSQTPLFNATQKGFYDMLPTFAKQGGGR